MKMWWLMITYIHINDNSIKSAYLWHNNYMLFNLYFCFVFCPIRSMDRVYLLFPAYFFLSFGRLALFERKSNHFLPSSATLRSKCVIYMDFI